MKKFGKLSTKFVLMILLLTTVVSVIIGAVIYKIIYTDALANSEKQLLQCSSYIRNMLSSADIDRWLESGKDDEYDKTYTALKEMGGSFNLTYLFVCRPCYDDSGSFSSEFVTVFGFMIKSSGYENRVTLGRRFSGVDETDEILKAINDGEGYTTEKIADESDGNQIFAFDPVIDENGRITAVIGASTSLYRTRSEALGEIFLIVGIFAGVMALFVAVMIAFIHKGVIAPVMLLSDRMDNFVSDFDEQHFIPVTEIRTHNEIELMAQAFNKMSESLITHTNELRASDAMHERIKADLNVARGIRSATSAETGCPAFPERKDFELYASLKNTVYNSCSFCNYILSDEDHLYIVIGESVGSSLSAMLMSMFAADNIRCLAKMGFPPYKIAAETNDQLCGFEHDENSLNVSAIIAEIELSSGIMRYVNAGMPRMLIKRPGEKYETEKPSMQFNLGEMRSVSFKQEQTELCQGCSIIFTSYGVADMTNANGGRFTAERVEDEINDIASKKYFLNEMIDELEQRLDSFRGENSSELDTTIVGFRYFG